MPSVIHMKLQRQYECTFHDDSTETYAMQILVRCYEQYTSTNCEWNNVIKASKLQHSEVSKLATKASPSQFMHIYYEGTPSACLTRLVLNNYCKNYLSNH